MKIKRILENDIIILTGHRNEGKTNALCYIIREYLKTWDGNVWTFGIKKVATNELSKIRPINRFHSIREMEKIRDSIVVADEAGTLLNVINRKQHENMLKTLRAVSHQNNIILLCSLPFDFKKIFAAQARCFLYKGMNIQELINGSLIKETLLEYKSDEEGATLGAYRLNVAKNKILCHDESGFWVDDVPYIKEMDSKRNNKSLFERR
jgi:hypothetical protein